MRYLLIIFITSFAFSQETITDSISFYYPTGEYSLNKNQKKELLVFLTEKDTTLIKKITIKGYTDFVGKTLYNKKLSKKRTQYLNDFLLENKITDNTQIPLGEIKNNYNYLPKKGIPKHRKTLVLCEYITTNQTNKLSNKYAYLLEIDSLKVGDKLRLKNINFLLATDILTKVSIPELDKLVSILTINKDLNIAIEGHVCCGAEKEVKKQKMTSDNEWLSSKRAKTIHDYLISKGIDSLRLEHKGVGFTQPLVYPEETEEDRRKNRRIELRILSNNHLEKLNSISIGESVILRNISFEWGKAEPTPDSFPEILNLFKVLDDFPYLEVEIQGHVCCGKKEYTTGEKKSHHNHTLSNNRAHNIEKKLIGLGIDSTRLSHKGLGFSQPKIYPEKTSEDRHINRRIEVVLVNK